VRVLARDVPVPALEAHVAAQAEVLRLTYEEPWSSAVFVCVAALRPGEGEPAAAIAARLSLPEPAVAHLLEVMTRGGVLERTADGRLRIVRPLTVDVPPDGDALRVRRHWARVSADRVAAPGERDRFSFNVCAVSEADRARLVELQSAYFRELRSIVAGTTAPEVVALVTMHTTWLE